MTIIVCPQCRCKWDRQHKRPENVGGLCKHCLWKARGKERTFYRRVWRVKRDLSNLRRMGACVLCGAPDTHTNDCLIPMLVQDLQERV